MSPVLDFMFCCHEFQPSGCGVKSTCSAAPLLLMAKPGKVSGVGDGPAAAELVQEHHWGPGCPPKPLGRASGMVVSCFWEWTETGELGVSSLLSILFPRCQTTANSPKGGMSGETCIAILPAAQQGNCHKAATGRINSLKSSPQYSGACPERSSWVINSSHKETEKRVERISLGGWPCAGAPTG